MAQLRTEAGGVRIVRPLLEISREETLAYCLKRGLQPRNDETNSSLSMFRNRIRLKLLLSLRSYNPAIDDALLRMARIAVDDIAYMDAESGRVKDEVIRSESGTIILNKARFLALPQAMKRHILRLCFEDLIGDLKDIETRHIEELLDALGKPAGRVFHLPYGLVFAVEYDRYLLGKNVDQLCPFPALERETSLSIPGVTELPGWSVTASVVAVERSADGDFGEDSASSGQPTSPLHLAARLDYDCTGDRLTVRSVRPGDRFEPLGLGHSKKVSEFMIDARVPRSWRKSVPIVSSPDGVVWVVGWRIDERVKVTENTRNVLRLKLERSYSAVY